ncbi:hypothetical protein [Yoonia sp.]|uniref:hypothetical protein n=1 Tax=Yoonia sp. TaxID=2212373 RepID=UPI0035C7F715
MTDRQIARRTDLNLTISAYIFNACLHQKNSLYCHPIRGALKHGAFIGCTAIWNFDQIDRIIIVEEVKTSFGREPFISRRVIRISVLYQFFMWHFLTDISAREMITIGPSGENRRSRAVNVAPPRCKVFAVSASYLQRCIMTIDQKYQLSRIDKPDLSGGWLAGLRLQSGLMPQRRTPDDEQRPEWRNAPFRFRSSNRQAAAL